MNIYIDIDNTITHTSDTDYVNAVPNYANIAKVNALYHQNHQITMWTARGTLSGIDYTELTRSQLTKWGVKYHHLKMQKPAFDLFIDDKALNVHHWEPETLRKLFGNMETKLQSKND